MYIQAKKPKENRSRAGAGFADQKRGNGKQFFGFADNRPVSNAQRQVDEAAYNCTFQHQKLFQNNESNTDLQCNLKSGFENSLVQMLPWPAKQKDQPKVTGTKWEGEDPDDVKTLYVWCNKKEHFYKIINATTQSEWSANKVFFTGPPSVEFDAQLDAAETPNDVVSLFAYFKQKASPPRILKTFDASTYVFPDHIATQLMTDAGIVQADYAREKLRASLGGVRLADEMHEKLVWEKNANKEVLLYQERQQKNTEIETALVELHAKIKELAAAKTKLDKEEAAIALHLTNVAAMVDLATDIPSFSAVADNPLSNAIWATSVNNAGKTGYLEVNQTIYKKATLTAATALLRTFSFDWKAIHADGTQYLSNPHTPGGGNPEDKKGHSNPEWRTSIYQADFIANWGGKTTVVHINSDSL